MSFTPDPRGHHAPAAGGPLRALPSVPQADLDAEAWPAWTDLPVDYLDLDRFNDAGRQTRRAALLLPPSSILGDFPAEGGVR